MPPAMEHREIRAARRRLSPGSTSTRALCEGSPALPLLRQGALNGPGGDAPPFGKRRSGPGRKKGLELSRPKAQEPKSCVSASFTTSAQSRSYGSTTWLNPSPCQRQAPGEVDRRSSAQAWRVAARSPEQAPGARLGRQAERLAQ